MIALAPTDTNWFHFLRDRAPLAIVNFWTPTDWNVKSLSSGDYWYFVLKGREPRRLGGGGKFSHYEILKTSQAWERYGTGNGVESKEVLIKKLNDYKQRNSRNYTYQNDPDIGCIVLADCIFLEDNRQRHVSEYALEFAPSIVKYKTFQVAPLHLCDFDENTVKDSNELLSDEDTRKRTLSSIVTRQGQSSFRQSLIVAYNSKCAITGCDAIDALEAAHIMPYRGPHSNTVRNGLLLRSDIHTLFDLGKITISNEYKVILHHDLMDTTYHELNGKLINLPTNRDDWPSLLALNEHNRIGFSTN